MHSTVGWIGTGVMGRIMAGHLLRAGMRVLVHDRERERARALEEAGASWREDVAGLAAESDVVFTMLGTARDVAEVYAGPDGLLESARPGTFLVDMTSAQPALARHIASGAAERGVHALDAPVSGDDAAAREARLSIMVGGEAADLEAVRPLLELLGASVVLHGPAGAGQHAQLAAQMAFAGALVGACEALAFARAGGLDPLRVLRSLESGTASSGALTAWGPRLLAGDYQPGLLVGHLLEHLGSALEVAEELEVDTPGLELARMLFQEVAEMGFAEAGAQSLFALWQDEEDDPPPELVQLGRR